jgi:hypothetical protein
MRAALRVGGIAGMALGLAAAASRLTTSPSMAALGTIIVLFGLAVAGYYAVEYSGAFESGATARTGAVAGLIAGVLASFVLIGVMLLQSLDPEMREVVLEATRQMSTPEQLQALAQSGVSLDAIYPMAVAFEIVCCGAGLPIFGIGFGAIGGSFAAFGRRRSNSPK